MVDQILHRKLKIEQREPHQKRWWNQMLGKPVNSSWSTNGTRRVTEKWHVHHVVGYKSAIIYNAFSIGYSLDKNTIK